MLINIGIFSALLLYFFNLDGIQGVPTNAERGKEYEKSLNTPKNGSRFHFMISTDKLMWKDASLACKKKGMILACLDTLEKRKQFNSALIKATLSSSYNFEFTDFWIGGFREPNSLAKFQWENGNFINSYGWMRGEPNYCPNEYCLEVKVFVTILGWNDVHCGKLSNYVCMYDDLEEETKNTEHIDKDIQRLESYEEENKNLETAESTTESTTEITFDRIDSNLNLGVFGKYHTQYYPRDRHWRHPISFHNMDDPMYDIDRMVPFVI